MSYDFESSSGQYITYTPGTNYTTKASFSVWFKLESTPSGTFNTIFSKGWTSNSGNRNLHLDYRDAGGGTKRLIVSWTRSSSAWNEWGYNVNLSTGTWHHFYGEIDWTTNPDTVSFWLNGSSVSSTLYFGVNDTTAPQTDATQELVIGSGHGGHGDPWDGLIAEVALWSDTSGSGRALGMYNSGSGGEASALYPTNLTEYISLRSDTNNSITSTSGTLSSSNPVLSSDHPFTSGSVTAIVTADSVTITNPSVSLAYGMTVTPTADSVTINNPNVSVLIGTLVSTTSDYLTIGNPSVTVPEIISVTAQPTVDAISVYSPSVLVLVRPTPWESASGIETAWATPQVSDSVWTPSAGIETTWRAHD